MVVAMTPMVHESHSIFKASFGFRNCGLFVQETIRIFLCGRVSKGGGFV